MIRFAAMTLIGALSAAAAAQTVIAYSGGPEAQPALRSAQAPAAVPANADEAVAQAQGDEAQIAKSADGHYWADADVNGHDVRFLVDTGATAVALTADDARRLGIDTASLPYDAQVMTASGPARAARVKLASISVSGAEVRDVDALVIENGLQSSLLGMTYLGRLSQFEATPSSMILRP